MITISNFQTMSLLFPLLILSGILSGQTELRIDRDTTVNTCNALLFDSGGAGQGYQPGENHIFTVCPTDSENGLKLELSELSLANDVASDTLSFYDGADLSAPLLAQLTFISNAETSTIRTTANNAEGCLTIDFKGSSGLSAPGWAGVLTCVQGCQEIAANLVPDNDTTLCLGEEKVFSASGVYPQNGMNYVQTDATSTFMWQLGDGRELEGTTINYTYGEGGGFRPTLTITDSIGCSATFESPASIQVAVQPDVAFAMDERSLICSGDTVFSQLTHLQVLELNDFGAASASVSSEDTVALPDGNGQTYTDVLVVSGFGSDQTINDPGDLLSVFVVMEHSWLRDLEIMIQCPNGQSVILHEFVTQTGNEIALGEPYDDLFDLEPDVPGLGYKYSWKEASDNGTWINYAEMSTAPAGTLPAGEYLPFESFAGLMGCPINGPWRLQVTDLWTSDSGFAFGWGLEIDPGVLPDNATFTVGVDDFGFLSPDNSVPVSNPDSIAGSVAVAGVPTTHIFRIEDDFGCTWDTTLQYVAAAPAPVVDAIITGDSLGGSGRIDVEVSSGLPPYTFAWLSVDSMELVDTTEDLSDLFPGRYDLTVTDANGCQSVASFSVGGEVTSTDLTKMDESLRIYPNPGGGQLRIEFLLAIPQEVEIRLTDLTGRVLKTRQLRGESNINTVDLSVTDLPAGMYLLQIAGRQGSWVSRRLAVQR